MTMRHVLMVFGLVFILGLTGCGNNSANTEGTNKDIVTEKDTQYTEAEIEGSETEEVTLENWREVKVQ